MASTIATGNRRPRPATAHTGVPASPATAANTVDPVAAITRVGVERFGLHEHDVGGLGGDRRRFHRHELTLDLVALEALHERRALVPGVEGQHAHVAAPHQGLGRHRWPADRRHGHAVGQRIHQCVDRRVIGDLVDRRPRRGHRVGAGQQPCAEPPQRTARRVALDDPPAGHHQPGRIEPQPAQGARPSRAPMTRRRRRGPWPRSGDARSDASTLRVRPSRACAPVATVRGRGHEPAARLVVGAAGRGGPTAGGVADDVPLGDRGPRPLHQRELVDPPDGDEDPRGPAGIRCPRQLPRDRR